jgi:hypothetical protein
MGQSNGDGGNPFASLMQSLPNMPIDPNAFDGMNQGHNGIAQGYNGSVHGQTAGPMEGMNRAAQPGAMEGHGSLEALLGGLGGGSSTIEPIPPVRFPLPEARMETMPYRPETTMGMDAFIQSLLQAPSSGAPTANKLSRHTTPMSKPPQGRQ